jgi:hypothetical protein
MKANIRLLLIFILVTALAWHAPAQAFFIKGGSTVAAGSSSSSGGGTSSGGSSSGGGGFAGLPTVAAPPEAVYSPYLLVAGYTGPLFQLTRISDNVTLDVYPVAITGAPDITAIQAFLGAAPYAAVTMVYDQSGNGHHAAGAKTWAYNAINGIYAINYDVNTPPSGTSFVIPTTLTGSGTATTVVDVVAYNSTNNSAVGILGQTLTGAGSISSSLGSGFNMRLAVRHGSAFNTSTTAKTRSQPQVLVVSSGASNINAWLDGVLTTFAAGTSSTWQGGRIGSTTTSSLFGNVFARIVYKAALDSTDAATLRSYLNSKYQILTTATAQLVWPGDSVVEGFCAAYGRNNQWYFEKALTTPMYISNQGISGQTAATQYANITAYTGQFRSDLAKNFMAAPAPSNDIDFRPSGTLPGFGTTLWTGTVRPFILAAKAAGFTVVAPTILPRNWAGDSTVKALKETERLAFNQLVRDNAVADGYTVVDYASIPEAANVFNTTYYCDGIHPNSTLYQIMGEYFATIMNPLLAANDNEPSGILLAANDNWYWPQSAMQDAR